MSLSTRRRLQTVLWLLIATSLTACAPTVGSDAWCKKMKETPAGDWSANDATAYAKNCILK